MQADRDEDRQTVRRSSNEPNYHQGRNKSMATTDNLQVLPSPNREFGLQVLRHIRADGTPVYTIGIWEEGILRCICHAHPIATALVALSHEFEDSAHNGPMPPSIPAGRKLPS